MNQDELEGRVEVVAYRVAYLGARWGKWVFYAWGVLRSVTGVWQGGLICMVIAVLLHVAEKRLKSRQPLPKRYRSGSVVGMDINEIIRATAILAAVQTPDGLGYVVGWRGIEGTSAVAVAVVLSADGTDRWYAQDKVSLVK